jgi:hypothetical protein
MAGLIVPWGQKTCRGRRTRPRGTVEGQLPGPLANKIYGAVLGAGVVWQTRPATLDLHMHLVSASFLAWFIYSRGEMHEGRGRRCAVLLIIFANSSSSSMAVSKTHVFVRVH